MKSARPIARTRKCSESLQSPPTTAARAMSQSFIARSTAWASNSASCAARASSPRAPQSPAPVSGARRPLWCEQSAFRLTTAKIAATSKSIKASSACSIEPALAEMAGLTRAFAPRPFGAVLLHRMRTIVLRYFVQKYGRPSGIELGPVDVVKYAEAFGAKGMMIRSPEEITPVLKRALDYRNG